MGENTQLTETLESQNSNEFKLEPKNLEALTTASKWANFLSILVFIVSGIFVLAGVVMIFFSPFITITYLVMAALYIIPFVYLNKFASNMKSVTSQQNIDVGFENLAKHYKFLGIMSIVVMSLYILVIIISIFVGFNAFVPSPQM